MFEENGGMDQTGEVFQDGAFSLNFPMEENTSSFCQQDAAAATAASVLEMELQRQFNANNDPNWQRMSVFDRISDSSDLIHTPNSFSEGAPYSATPEMLNILSLPLTPRGMTYDHHPLLPLNLPPPQPPFSRDLFHSLPSTGLMFGAQRNGSLFDPVDERDEYRSGVFDFSGGEAAEFCIGKNREGKTSKPFVTERHRRVLLNEKYDALKKLVPNPTKNDRASTVGNAIIYINELKRTVAELKALVEKKRCARERLRMVVHKPEEDVPGNESMVVGDANQENGSLRSSWLHRKSKNTEIDVKIIDDEVTVKLVQQKRINCLIFVTRALHELHLDLHHVAGGLIGDYYTFLFNSKIYEGSTVYASALATKLIEVLDQQYAAAADPPPNIY